MTEKTEDAAPVAAKYAKKSRFTYVDESKRPKLTDLNRRARGLAHERRADLDQKHDVVAKAVAQAFGRKAGADKPVVPKGSSMSSELKAKAAAATKDRENASKAAGK
jgi:tetrahydromethanopterin S-methyltransferase subunit G